MYFPNNYPESNENGLSALNSPNSGIKVLSLVSTPIIKRYFITDSLTSDLPHWFINSTNQKQIVVITSRFFYIDSETLGEENEAKLVESILEPKFITLHGDFIHDERHMDSMVIFCNEPVIKRKKYEQLGRQTKINIWFKNLDGTKIDIQEDNDGYFVMEGGVKRKIKFVLELLLIG